MTTQSGVRARAALRKVSPSTKLTTLKPSPFKAIVSAVSTNGSSSTMKILLISAPLVWTCPKQNDSLVKITPRWRALR